ncbi:MAG: hypothetical protein Kapaf2KO_06500 [Candidatus Kapaibacteriales bacterium]
MNRKMGKLFRLNIAITAQLILFVLAVPAFSEADAAQIKEDVEKLASDEFGGRRPGTPGIEKAASYIEKRFESIGLMPKGTEGYRQSFSTVENLEIDPSTELSVSLIIPKRGIPREKLRPITRNLDVGEDFVPYSYSSDGSVTADLVFAGFGISAQSYGYDDYNGIDAKGKIAVILTGNPATDANGLPKRMAGFGQIYYKIHNAEAHGAVGVIFLGAKGDSANVMPRMEYMEANGRSDMPVVFSKRQTFEKFFPKALSLITTEETIVETGKPKSFNLEDRSASLTVKLNYKVVNTANIIGMVKGTDNADEVLVVGAHYDHLGLSTVASRDSKNLGEIHNGADDNASGVAAMLDIANQIAKSPLPRSVLFIAFTGEEMGLLGSSYFVKEPTVDLNEIKMMINMDMVGMYKDSLTLYGSGAAKGLTDIIDNSSSLAGINVRKVNIGSGPSDHLHFYRSGIPAIHLFSGMHDHYHRHTDDADMLNYEGINSISEFTMAMLGSLSRSEITYMEPKVETEDEYVFGETMVSFRPTGFFATFEQNPEGIEMLEVIRNSRAWKSGIRPGDVIVEVNGNSVSTINAMRYNVIDLISRMQDNDNRSSAVIQMKVKRGNDIVPISLTL